MITIKAVGIVIDNEIVKNFPIGDSKIRIGRNVKWIDKESITIENPNGKNNVVNNSFYEEFNPEIQKIIIDKFKVWLDIIFTWYRRLWLYWHLSLMLYIMLSYIPII